MKKRLFALGFLALQNAYALPTQLTEEVYLKSFSCGGDSCYLSIEIANVDNVHLSTFCSDGKYCMRYHTAYEKRMETASEDEYFEYDLNHQKARVNLKLVDNPYSGQKMYETQSIVYLKD